MILYFDIEDKTYYFDSSKPIDISIPLNFNQEQPNAFGVPEATSEPVISSGFTGDTRKGGSCNFEEIKLIPHCNGTHTECIGHISIERIHINELLKKTLFKAVLITAKPINNKDDKLITYESINEKLLNTDSAFHEALIIRTLPNDDSKLTRNYMNEPPPYITEEAMKYIVSLDIKHLLVDIPSLDRTYDEGKLSAHRIFWGVEHGEKNIDPDRYTFKTITEMIYVPPDIVDGNYMLDIQIPNYTSDAVSSRPLIYELKNTYD